MKKPSPTACNVKAWSLIYPSTRPAGSGPIAYSPLELPLFPRYVFCRFDYWCRLPVLVVPGVRSIVGFGGDPISISESEIGHIQSILSSGLPTQPWPFIRVGQPVRIQRGSLAGLEGILLREKDTLRVVVSVELLQPLSRRVEIDRDSLCGVYETRRGCGNCHLVNRVC